MGNLFSYIQFATKMSNDPFFFKYDFVSSEPVLFSNQEKKEHMVHLSVFFQVCHKLTEEVYEQEFLRGNQQPVTKIGKHEVVQVNKHDPAAANALLDGVLQRRPEDGLIRRDGTINLLPRSCNPSLDTSRDEPTKAMVYIVPQLLIYSHCTGVRKKNS